jgi:2,4-dienoyl-CoA reductase-like NADH-dependent reductase (Old Yellow Enzyme family)
MPLEPGLEILFTPVRIGAVTVPNRFVRSATHDFLAEEDGSVTPAQAALYRALAEGEVGLIVSGHAFVHPSGKASPRQIAAHDDRFIPGLAALSGAVRCFPSRVFLQLAHAGRQTKEKLCGCHPLAPSAVPDPSSGITPREMTAADILRTIDDFAAAAGRAARAGFDGVQLHMAHGYLLSGFLSPHTNRRRDAWGGPLENRVRIAADIVRAVKAALGADFPVIAKMNAADLLEGGLTGEDSAGAARLLESAGLDGLEVSGGMAEAGRGSMWPGVRPEEEEGYFVPFAERVKAAVRIPVIGLGGLRTAAVMARLIREGRVDLVSMSRPFVRQPGLVRGIREGSILKSDCLSCNKCLNPRGLRCAELRT